MKEFRLPDPGEGLVEAEIVTWHVAVGDEVKINDVLLEVETSKSLVELPSPYAGTVTELLAEEGSTVDVGAPIITIDDGTGTDGSPDESGETTDRVANLVGYGPKQSQAKRRPRKSRHGSEPDAPRAETHAQVAATFDVNEPVSRRADVRDRLPAHQADAAGEPLPGPGSIDRPASAVGQDAVLAKPPVRKLAKDLGIDLAGVTGSGPSGVVTRDDVLAAADADSGAEPAPGAVPIPEAAQTGDRRIPIKGVRKATAEAMVRSAFTAPHVTEWLTCDVSASMELLDRLRVRREFTEVRVSPLLLVAKAVCLAARRTPEINSSWDSDASEIVLKDALNLGIATATPRGLLVPNVKNADRLGLVELATSINELVSLARESKTQPADTAKGSFTITNVGSFGVDAGTPILNPGEAGILALGSIARRPWVVGAGESERIEPRWVTTLALSFDHRLVDGEQGSRFLADVAALLSDPGLALLH